MKASKRFVYDETLKRVVQVPTRTAPPGGCDKWRKHASVSAGVPSSQAAEHREFVRQHGLSGVDVLPNGDIHCSGPMAHYKYLKARGMHNRDGNR